ncbi:MFS general substrate transporter [Panaeolus papilionaceus]|nr:MFS general substrate transporter [Panaeolus papilionaceus]
MSAEVQSAVNPLPGSYEKKEKESRDEAEQERERFQVVLDDHELPRHLSITRKWISVLVISTAALCAAFTEDGVAQTFKVGHEVTILSISFFIEGLGLGPLIMGPLSELYGRNNIYRISYTIYFGLTWAVAFAPNIDVHLIFRFFTGFAGSAFLSVAGGSVSDLFSDATVANPMAFYTMCPFIGPVIGPLIGGFINQNLNWRWTYYIMLMWTFGEWLAILFLIPETYVPLLVTRKAHRMRKKTGDDRYWAPLEQGNCNLWRRIAVSCYRPFQLLFHDRMALLLDIWSALVLGILYLTFQAFPIIFGGVHHFNMQTTGLSFAGIGVGMGIGICTQAYWNNLYARTAAVNNGNVPPETRLIMGEIGAVLVPMSLFWLAFTTYRGIPWIVPIIASIPFGTGTYFVFTSTFTYLVTAYRPIAASAMASNSALRSTFAAAFPLFAPAMYHRLGTVGATALLAGLTAVMVPLPFIFRRIGGRLRQRSEFAVHE